MVDGPDAVVAEHRGEDALEDFAIGQHVGNAAGHAQVVFEDGEAAIGQAHKVGAADADVNVARDVEAAHFAAEVLAAVDQVARDDAFGKDAAFVIDVAEEEIEGGQALREAFFDLRPFVSGNDSRNQIVGEDALGAFFAAVHREGDAFLEEREIGGLLAFAQFFGSQAEQRALERLIVLARDAG